MIKIVLVDDHAVVREGYRALLARQPDMVVAGEFGDAHSAYQERFGGARGALDNLSVREFEVLRMLLDGRSVDAIAGDLALSPKTVRNVHYAVKRKLNVRDDIELVRLAVRLDVVDLIDLAGESSAASVPTTI